MHMHVHAPLEGSHFHPHAHRVYKVDMQLVNGLQHQRVG